jgi:hypothetical protein
MYQVSTILSIIVILLLQPGSVQVILHQDDHNNDDTIAIMQLVVVLYQDKYKTIQPFHLSTTAPATATTDTATTTVRRPLSSAVPGSASEYSVTSTDGEKLLLRSMYRVQDLVIGIFDGDDDDVDIIQLVAHYAKNNYSYRMKLTPTTEDTSYYAQNNYSYRMKLTPIKEDTSYSNTANIKDTATIKVTDTIKDSISSNERKEWGDGSYWH